MIAARCSRRNARNSSLFHPQRLSGDKKAASPRTQTVALLCSFSSLLTTQKCRLLSAPGRRQHADENLAASSLVFCESPATCKLLLAPKSTLTFPNAQRALSPSAGCRFTERRRADRQTSPWQQCPYGYNLRDEASAQPKPAGCHRVVYFYIRIKARGTQPFLRCHNQGHLPRALNPQVHREP